MLLPDMIHVDLSCQKRAFLNQIRWNSLIVAELPRINRQNYGPFMVTRRPPKRARRGRNVGGMHVRNRREIIYKRRHLVNQLLMH